MQAPRTAVERALQIENNTNQEIIAIFVSEGGEHRGSFDIGSGIGMCETADLGRDASTDECGYGGYFMACSQVGRDSERVAFDCCDSERVIRFN